MCVTDRAEAYDMHMTRFKINVWSFTILFRFLITIISRIAIECEAASLSFSEDWYRAKIRKELI